MIGNFSDAYRCSSGYSLGHNGTTQNRFDSCNQFVGIKRFDHIVIGAEL